MNPELKQHLTASDTWIRGLYIVIFAVIYSVTDIVLTAVVVFQFLAALFTGQTNARLQTFGSSLATYVYQILAFMTFNTDEKPFPFSPWPEGQAPRREPEEGEMRP